MKLFSKAIAASTALCLAACTPDPGGEPVEGSGTSENANPDGNPEGSQGLSEGTGPETTPNNPLADRIRLPNMENLPSDKELASNKPEDKGGNSVIVRPPSD